MATSHAIREEPIDGFAARVLVSPEGLEARFVPAAGMVCCSLRQGDLELLGQRDGLPAYARAGSTMGIPLLHPWANRLARRGYVVGDVAVQLPPDSPRVHEDGHELPIHGLLAGCPDWAVIEAGADREMARLVAELDLASRPDLMALFPFPHVLRVSAMLSGNALTIDTVLCPSGTISVPVAFGYHPYLRIPGVPRADWEVTLPVRRRARLDERCLPTGESEEVRIPPALLGNRVYDDLFTDLDPDPVFVLAGGGRRIETRFGPGYDVAVVYAPADDDVICFEPMTAPTNPFEGGAPLRWARPSHPFSARFSIVVV